MVWIGTAYFYWMCGRAPILDDNDECGAHNHSLGIMLLLLLLGHRTAREVISSVEKKLDIVPTKGSKGAKDEFVSQSILRKRELCVHRFDSYFVLDTTIRNLHAKMISVHTYRRLG